jgi:hypothetical protein
VAAVGQASSGVGVPTLTEASRWQSTLGAFSAAKPTEAKLVDGAFELHHRSVLIGTYE